MRTRSKVSGGWPTDCCVPFVVQGTRDPVSKYATALLPGVQCVDDEVPPPWGCHPPGSEEVSHSLAIEIVEVTDAPHRVRPAPCCHVPLLLEGHEINEARVAFSEVWDALASHNANVLLADADCEGDSNF